MPQSRARLFALVSVMLATTMPIRAQTFTFEGTPVGTTAPFVATSGGVRATFTTPVVPNGFTIVPSFFSSLQGNTLLSVAADPTNTLLITFSAPLSRIGLDFATNGAGTVTLEALAGATPVGSVTASGVVPGGEFTFPEGTLDFAGDAFQSVRLRSTAEDFAIDNLRVVGTAPGLRTFFGQNRPGQPDLQTAQRDFLAALRDQGNDARTETFEDFSPGATAPLALGFSGAEHATLDGTAHVQDFYDNGLHAISGTKYVFVLTQTGTEMTVTFERPITAFGFSGTDLGDFGAGLRLDLLRPAGASSSVVVPYELPGADGNELFFGLIDAHPFTAVRFVSTGSADGWGFDDLIIGTPAPIPEPRTVVLVGLGLLGLGLVSRRRRVG
jgi:hypothetical protein